MTGVAHTVALVGAMDTKGDEYAFLRSQLHDLGIATLLVDTGVSSPTVTPVDIDRFAVAEAGGETIATLLSQADRGAAMATMRTGARVVVNRLAAEGRVHGALGVGGSSGTSIVAHAVTALPMGMPKLVVSTLASSDVSPFVGTSDLVMMPSITDLAGLNVISMHVLTNAAAAMAGMVRARSAGMATQPASAAIGGSMFANTMPALNQTAALIGDLGVDVVPFHATRTGGETMESLLSSGLLSGLLDLTTSGLASELVDSPWAAKPERLTVAGKLEAPTVVAPGAMDMAVFGGVDSLPEHVRGRLRYVHNASTTLVRTTTAENAKLGRRMAERLRGAERTCVVCVPLRGFSESGAKGGPFEDREADMAFVETLREEATVRLVEVDDSINGAAFAEVVAREFTQLYRAHMATRATA